MTICALSQQWKPWHCAMMSIIFFDMARRLSNLNIDCYYITHAVRIMIRSKIFTHGTSLADMLDRWEVQMVADFLSSFHVSLLRASCQWTSVNIIDPMKKEEHNAEWLLRRAAYYNHRDLCILAREWKATNFNEMLINATCGADPIIARGLCKLARKWIGGMHSIDAWRNEVDLNGMLIEATRNNCRELCELAYKWAKHSDTPRARYLHPRSTARNASPLNFNSMLLNAVSHGYRELCELAHEWLIASGINPDFNNMLISAAYSGRCDLCILARDWARTSTTHERVAPPKTSRASSGAVLNFNAMLHMAAKGGHRNICELARKWAHEEPSLVPLNFNDMLLGASWGNHRDIYNLAREWAQMECPRVCETRSKNLI